jgi:hypothetical protein
MKKQLVAGSQTKAEELAEQISSQGTEAFAVRADQGKPAPASWTAP